MLEQPEFAGKAFEARARSCRGGNQGQTQLVTALAHEFEHGLDGRGIRLPEIGLERGREAALQFAGFGPMLLRAARTMLETSLGISLEATLMRPCASYTDGAEGEVVVAGRRS